MACWCSGPEYTRTESPSTILQRLEYWIKQNKNVCPRKILIYRDDTAANHLAEAGAKKKIKGPAVGRKRSREKEKVEKDGLV